MVHGVMAYLLTREQYVEAVVESEAGGVAYDDVEITTVSIRGRFCSTT